MDQSSVKQLTKISKYFKLYNRTSGLGAKISKPRILNKTMMDSYKLENSKSTHDLNKTTLDMNNIKKIDKFPKLGMKQSATQVSLHSS